MDFFKHEAFNKPSACSISFPSDQTLPHGLRTPSPWLRAAACLYNLPRVVSDFPRGTQFVFREQIWSLNFFKWHV